MTHIDCSPWSPAARWANIAHHVETMAGTSMTQYDDVAEAYSNTPCRWASLIITSVVMRVDQSARLNLGIHPGDPMLDFGAGERQLQIAHANAEQLLVVVRRPLGRRYRVGCRFHHSVRRS